MKAFTTALLVFSALVHPTAIQAQWQLHGAAISTAFGSQNDPTIVSDGSGGAIVTWHDDRSGNFDIYAQRVNALGVVQWTADGVALCTAANEQSNPTIVSDGSGGAIVTWVDFRSGNNDIYAQRVNAAGAVQWTADGVAVCAQAWDQCYPTIVSDGSGGAIVTWHDFRAPNLVPKADIYAQRVNAAGVAQWTTDGVALCTNESDQFYPTIASDGSGGAIVTWHDFRVPNADIYAQRVNAAGAVQWTFNGVPLCTVATDQRNPMIVSDGSGGAIVTWYDYRSGGNPDIYAQRVNAAGAVQWTANGVALCTAADDQRSPVIVSDGSGGAIVTWVDFRSGNNDIYAQRVNTAGVAQWTADGVALCTAANNQSSTTIVSDGSGGAIATWHDFRSGSNYDIYAQRVNAAGVAQWTADGVALCTDPSNQFHPTIASDGSGGAIATWYDTRNGLADIYAQRFNQAGQPPVFVVSSTADDNTTGTLRAAINVANSTPGAQTISFNIPGAGAHTIQLQSALPAITDALTIDGYTQPGASPNTNPVGSSCNAQIMIDIHGGFTGDGFRFQEPGTLRGLATHSFAGRDVIVEANPVVIEGNFVGLDPFGGGGWANQVGIWIGASGCRVGGATPAARNVITGGFISSVGVQIEGAQYAQIIGNYIGTGLNPANGDGNPTGVLIEGGALFNTVGFNDLSSPNLEEANIIAYNGTAISVLGYGTLGNAVFGNSFRDNTTMGIDLGGDGRTLNDVFDDDDGPNGLLNFPDLSAATGTQVTGTLHGAPNNTFILYFYRSSSCGSGDVYLGLLWVDTDGFGNAPFTFTPAQPMPPAFITATARDIFGDTSEMSDCVVVMNPTGVGAAPLPTTFALRENIPNPFNPQTTIRYDVPAGSADVNITIYDVAGRQVRELVDEYRAAGTWSVQWNGEDDRGQRVASGVYFYRMRAGGFVETRKMVLLK